MLFLYEKRRKKEEKRKKKNFALGKIFCFTNFFPENFWEEETHYMVC